ncbi:NADH-quinone oxidoreductase subunit C [bacterium]|nr:NADH-quinone oxidoreductase subunit C [bacterium]
MPEVQSLPLVQIELEKSVEEVFGNTFKREEPQRWVEYGLTFRVAPESLLSCCQTLKEHRKFLFNMLIDITAVDFLDSRRERFDVVYQFLSLTYQSRLCLKVAVTEEQPAVASVRSLWAAANFLEREVWDMYGIDFPGHGDLRRILMYDEFVGHPLRKDYHIQHKQPRVPLRLPELRNESVDMNKAELVSLPSRQKSLEKQSVNEQGAS